MNDFEPCLNCPDLTHEIDGLQIEIRERDKRIAELEVELYKPCGACGGSGKLFNTVTESEKGIKPLGVRVCPHCSGTGRVRRWVVPQRSIKTMEVRDGWIMKCDDKNETFEVMLEAKTE